MPSFSTQRYTAVKTKVPMEYPVNASKLQSMATAVQHADITQTKEKEKPNQKKGKWQ
jgi:hypothetical protein